MSKEHNRILSTIETIKRVLSPLCLYNLNDESLVTKELTVYSDEIDLLHTELENILKEFFINTATDYGIYLRERIFGSIKSNLPLNERRKILLNRYSEKSYKCNKKSVEKSLISAGMNGYITEYPERNLLYINCLNMFDTTITREMAERIILEFIPAHLDVEFDYRTLTWEHIDNLDLDFSNIDETDLTWENIDNYDESQI